MMAVANPHELNRKVVAALGLDRMLIRELEIRFAVDECATVKVLCFVTEQQGANLIEQLEWREFLVEVNRKPPRVREIRKLLFDSWWQRLRWLFFGQAPARWEQHNYLHEY
jgi:hypothetical protein